MLKPSKNFPASLHPRPFPRPVLRLTRPLCISSDSAVTALTCGAAASAPGPVLWKGSVFRFVSSSRSADAQDARELVSSTAVFAAL